MKKVFVYGLYLSMCSYNRRCLRPCSPPSDSSLEWIAFGLLTAAFCHLIDGISSLSHTRLRKSSQQLTLYFVDELSGLVVLFWNVMLQGQAVENRDGYELKKF